GADLRPVPPAAQHVLVNIAEIAQREDVAGGVADQTGIAGADLRPTPAAGQVGLVHVAVTGVQRQQVTVVVAECLEIAAGELAADVIAVLRVVNYGGKGEQVVQRDGGDQGRGQTAKRGDGQVVAADAGEDDLAGRVDLAARIDGDAVVADAALADQDD